MTEKQFDKTFDDLIWNKKEIEWPSPVSKRDSQELDDFLLYKGFYCAENDGNNSLYINDEKGFVLIIIYK